MSQRDETSAVRERYGRRDPSRDAERYSPLSPSVYLAEQERERALIRVLSSHGLEPLSARTLVEVGCGGGKNLLQLLRLGFAPENLRGVELLEERAARARGCLPAAVQIATGDAASLPVATGSIDVVFQSLVFSSILDPGFRAALADRMWGWVRPGGGVLWYDFTFDNPANPDVRGVPVAELRRLFPAGRVEVRRVTLAPPISRRVTRLWPGLYGLLNAIPLLRTHVVAWIAKPS